MSAPLCEHCTSHDRGACEGVRQFATITAACSCGCHFAPQVGGAVVLVSSDALAAAVARAAAAEARHAALAGAVREVGDLIAEHGCSCDCDCAHTTGEHTSACDPCLACRASDVVSPLLRGAAPDVVRAGVVRPCAPSTCRSDDDGDCRWSRCPQRLDGEPWITGRACPLIKED